MKRERRRRKNKPIRALSYSLTNQSLLSVDNKIICKIVFIRKKKIKRKRLVLICLYVCMYVACE